MNMEEGLLCAGYIASIHLSLQREPRRSPGPVSEKGVCALPKATHQEREELVSNLCGWLVFSGLCG